ncbi:MAG: DUF5106 domain-containing protein [Cytophagaceae bacterium]|nr:DUF5106 domain-containing protein [Cytophagaceae bacterium]
MLFKEMVIRVKKLLIALLFGLAFQATAQTSGYRIEANIKGIRDSTCFLAHYLDKQHSIKDTAKVDANGNILFEGTTALPQGLYVISIGRWRYFDVLVADDQQFALRTDTTNFITNMKVEGSRENSLFYGFNQAMQKRFEEIRVLQMEQKLKGESLAPVKIRNIQKEMGDYRNQFINDNAGSFTAKLLKASSEPDIPPAPKLPTGRVDSLFAYRYYKAHYFDNLDLADERMLRTPLLAPKLERYFSDLVVQSPDSLSKEADFVMSKVPKSNPDLRKFYIYKITSPYETPTILGTDAFFVHMGEKYYVGEPQLWDASTVKRFRERIAVLKPLLPGQKIPDMPLTDTLGRAIPLHGVKADYTVLFIYDPECGHCREAAPKVMEFYKKVKGQNIAVYAANVKRDPTIWKKFIREFKTQNLINGMDSKGQVDFLNGFDAQSTPVIYVLDKDKKIIARRLPAPELEKFWEFLQRQKAGDKPQATTKPAEKKKVAGR